MATSEITHANGTGKAKKSLILNAFVESCSGHQSPGLWQHPDDESSDFNDLDHWVKLAKLLEDAKVHGIFIADVLGGYDVYKGPRNLEPAIVSGAQWPVNEPLVRTLVVFNSLLIRTGSRSCYGCRHKEHWLRCHGSYNL